MTPPQTPSSRRPSWRSANTASTLRGYFTDQGLLGCERVRPINPADGSVPREPVIEALHLTAADSFGLNRGGDPGALQIQINLPAGLCCSARWASSQGGNAGVPGGGNQDNGQILGVVKLRERIVFDYDNGAVSHDGKRSSRRQRRHRAAGDDQPGRGTRSPCSSASARPVTGRCCATSNCRSMSTRTLRQTASCPSRPHPNPKRSPCRPRGAPAQASPRPGCCGSCSPLV